MGGPWESPGPPNRRADDAGPVVAEFIDYATPSLNTIIYVVSNAVRLFAEHPESTRVTRFEILTSERVLSNAPHGMTSPRVRAVA